MTDEEFFAYLTSAEKDALLLGPNFATKTTYGGGNIYVDPNTIMWTPSAPATPSTSSPATLYNEDFQVGDKVRRKSYHTSSSATKDMTDTVIEVANNQHGQNIKLRETGWEIAHHYELATPKVSHLKCECGADSVGGDHVSYCQKYSP